MQSNRTSKIATWYVYISMVFWTLLMIAALWWLGVAVGLLPRKSRGKFFRRIILWYGRLMIYVAAFPVVRVSYENRGADRGEPGLYIFNHRSASDPFLVAALGLPAIQIVNGWPMRLPFFRLRVWTVTFSGRRDSTVSSVRSKPAAVSSGSTVRIWCGRSRPTC